MSVKREIEDPEVAKDVAWKLVEASISYSFEPLPNDCCEFEVKGEAGNLLDKFIGESSGIPGVVIKG